MARKPIAQEYRGLQTPRERVWRAILTAPKVFTKMGVQDLCNPMVQLDAVDDYLEALEHAGFIQRVGGGAPMARGQGRTEIEYSLGAQRPHEAPRLTQQGAPVTQGMATLSMWRAMKVLKVFDFHQVAAAATLDSCVVHPMTAKHYVKHLGIAGYLQQVRPGKPGIPATWRLARNTGPHAPAITRLKAVFDRNTGKFETLQTAQEVCDALDEA